MNRTETLAVMSILKAAYPAYYRDMKRQDAEAVVNLWAEMLADYPADLVAAAVKSHIASDRKGFPPHIGAIIAAIGDISRPAELSGGSVGADCKGPAEQRLQQREGVRRPAGDLAAVGRPSIPAAGMGQHGHRDGTKRGAVQLYAELPGKGGKRAQNASPACGYPGKAGRDGRGKAAAQL